MKLEELLLQKKSHILKRWLDLILETYPLDAQRFLKHQKDQFLNPVGSTISREIEILFQEAIKGINPERTCASLDGIIRIRAIQDFSPSEAVSFVFLLKIKTLGLICLKLPVQLFLPHFPLNNMLTKLTLCFDLGEM